MPSLSTTVKKIILLTENNPQRLLLNNSACNLLSKNYITDIKLSFGRNQNIVAQHLSQFITIRLEVSLKNIPVPRVS